MKTSVQLHSKITRQTPQLARQMGTPPGLPTSRSKRGPSASTRIAGAALASIAAFIGIGGLCGAGPASAAEISPYFQGYSTGTLVDALRNDGLTHTTLAFAVTRGSCAFDAYIADRMADARNYKAAGGDLIISMGGADGVYAEIACTDDQMFVLMDKLIVDSGTRRIDWDVEGQQLNNVDANARRNRVLLRLKAKYPDLKTSFTLPGWLNGLQANGMALMRQAIAAGVPQLILPFAHDQPDNAHIIKRLNLGDFHDPHRIRFGRLKDQIHGLLTSESVANACQEARNNQNRFGEKCPASEALVEMLRNFRP
jgi:hypothetical protein